VGVVSELSEQVPPTSNVSLTGGEDAERGDIEDIESDAQKYTIRHDLDFVEFSRGDDTVRKGAGRSFLGVPMLSDEDLKTTPAFVAREIYSLAHKCPVRTADHGTFSATDGTKGYPTTIVCDPETFKPCAPDGHANITGRSNTETQDKYNPGSAHNVLSVLTKGPHISLDGIARKRADGTTRTREEISARDSGDPAGGRVHGAQMHGFQRHLPSIRYRAGLAHGGRRGSTRPDPVPLA